MHFVFYQLLCSPVTLISYVGNDKAGHMVEGQTFTIGECHAFEL